MNIGCCFWINIWLVEHFKGYVVWFPDFFKLQNDFSEDKILKWSIVCRFLYMEQRLINVKRPWLHKDSIQCAQCPYLKVCKKKQQHDLKIFGGHYKLLAASNTSIVLSLLSLLSLSISVYIYIYSHPQTDCFVLLELFSVARHAGRLKLGSKPVQLYVSPSIRPLGQQAYHVS